MDGLFLAVLVIWASLFCGLVEEEIIFLSQNYLKRERVSNKNGSLFGGRCCPISIQNYNFSYICAGSSEH